MADTTREIPQTQADRAANRFGNRKRKDLDAIRRRTACWGDRAAGDCVSAHCPSPSRAARGADVSRGIPLRMPEAQWGGWQNWLDCPPAPSPPLPRARSLPRAARAGGHERRCVGPVVGLLKIRPQLLYERPILALESEVAQWLACWAHNPKVRGSKPRFANLSPRPATTPNMKHYTATTQCPRTRLASSNVTLCIRKRRRGASALLTGRMRLACYGGRKRGGETRGAR